MRAVRCAPPSSNPGSLLAGVSESTTTFAVTTIPREDHHGASTRSRHPDPNRRLPVLGCGPGRIDDRHTPAGADGNNTYPPGEAQHDV
jgi:hypothetical protein